MKGQIHLDWWANVSRGCVAVVVVDAVAGAVGVVEIVEPELEPELVLVLSLEPEPVPELEPAL